MVSKEITTATPEGALALMVYANATQDRELTDKVIAELPEGYRWHTMGKPDSDEEQRVHDAVSGFGLFGVDVATREDVEKIAREHKYYEPWLLILRDKNPERLYREIIARRELEASV